jgi:hypothetical protein
VAEVLGIVFREGDAIHHRAVPVVADLHRRILVVALKADDLFARHRFQSIDQALQQWLRRLDDFPEAIGWSESGRHGFVGHIHAKRFAGVRLFVGAGSQDSNGTSSNVRIQDDMLT